MTVEDHMADTLDKILEILQAQEARACAKITRREIQEDWHNTRMARLLIKMWETESRRKRKAEEGRPSESIYEMARRPLPGDDAHFKIGDKITFDGGLTWRVDPVSHSGR